PRMIIFGMYLAEDVPFRTVYFHGMVNDEHNQKMSKSKGNVISPIEVSEKYGTDALRLSLLIGNTPGNSLALSLEKVATFRNFTNKLWNIARYTMQFSEAVPEKTLSLSDRWILERLSEVQEAVTSHLEKYQLSLAGELLRDFTWNDFADWYIEIHKTEKNDAVLRRVFETLLRLWHPFMPFVTEALFQNFQNGEKKLLMIELWPTLSEQREKESLQEFSLLQELITQVRNIRAEYHIDPKKFLTLSVSGPSFFQENESVVKKLARLETVAYGEAKNIPGTARIVGQGYTAFVRLENIVDIEVEKRRLGEEKGNLEKYRTNLTDRLADPNFIQKAPQVVIDQNQTSLNETKRKISEIDKALASLT
ncbi:MAG: class I tRNA ligase family protein, partial [bacterium]|nr:class I tRNA ligase family protein [bacterium]